MLLELLVLEFLLLVILYLLQKAPDPLSLFLITGVKWETVCYKIVEELIYRREYRQ